PLLRALKTLGKQERNPVLKSTIEALAESVEAGGTFSEALALHPNIFTKLYVNMVKAGEMGGVLDVVLARLSEFQEKSERIKGKITSAMAYPIVVLFIAFGILIFLMAFIVPKFQAIFKDMLNGAALPWLTQMVIDFSDMLTKHWLVIFGTLAVIVVGIKVFLSTDFGSKLSDRTKLKIPVLGDLVTKTAISRFTRTLGTLVSSGVSILAALNITKETAGNQVVSDAIGKIHDSVKEGETVVGPLEASGIFPPIVVSMVQVGEEVGRLPEMLVRVADVYDEEVDTAVGGLTSLLEPLMIVGLAFVVGTIVIALFLPLISIIQNLGNQTG
ncbi:MAG TPA: type II secretion system F family protein, partial [Candidatus Methylacidiphilales bacterium]